MTKTLITAHLVIIVTMWASTLIAAEESVEPKDDQGIPTTTKMVATCKTLLALFKQPKVTAFRIDGRPRIHDNKDVGKKVQRPQFHDWPILESKELDGTRYFDVAGALLRKEATFGGPVIGCFTPGFALRAEEDKERVDILVCLECRYVQCRKGDTVITSPLSNQGLKAFKEIYKAIFVEEKKAKNANDKVGK